MTAVASPHPLVCERVYQGVTVYVALFSDGYRWRLPEGGSGWSSQALPSRAWAFEAARKTIEET